MHVEQILSDKNRTTITIGPDQTMAEAVETLNRHRIGAVVVVDAAGGVAGIVSERDIVSALAAAGASALEDRVADRMTRKVVTCARSASIPELMGLMTDGKFRHVPVVEDGRLSGIVSIGDIVKHRLAEVEAEHEALKEYIGVA